MFMRDECLVPMSSPGLTLFDYKFIDGTNIACKDCGVSYQKETLHKMNIFTVRANCCMKMVLSACFLNLNDLILLLKHAKTLVSIYNDLVPGKNDLDQRSLPDSSNTYAISRTWVTSFKVYVEKTASIVNKPSNEGNNSICGGIDALKLNAVTENDDASRVSGAIFCSDTTETLDPFKGEDPTSKISCEQILFFFIVIAWLFVQR